MTIHSGWVLASRSVRLLILVLLAPCASVSGQDPSVGKEATAADAAAEEPPPLSFVELLPEGPREKSDYGPVREGYLTLIWSPMVNAAHYSLQDEAGIVYYRGGRPLAFISGLPNGEHRFTVEAHSNSGDVLGKTLVPATVQVDHWPLVWVFVLLLTGFIVFITVIAVIIFGERSRDPKGRGRLPASLASDFEREGVA